MESSVSTSLEWERSQCPGKRENAYALLCCWFNHLEIVFRLSEFEAVMDGLVSFCLKSDETLDTLTPPPPPSPHMLHGRSGWGDCRARVSIGANGKAEQMSLSCTGIRAHIHEYYEISSILYLSFFLSKCLFLSLLLSIPCSTHTPIVASFFSCAYNFSTVSLCLYALFSLYIYRIFLTPFGVSSTYFFDSQSGIGVVCKAIFHLHLL